MPDSSRRSTGPKRPKLFVSESELYDYAVGALGRRMRTEQQLKQLLRRRVERDSGPALIAAVVVRLKAQQYLSDARYAAAYSTQRKEGPHHGRRRVAQDLMQKGVHPEVIARELDSVYEGTTEEQQARAFLARKRIGKPEDQRQAARLFRQLARAGFSGAVAVRILRQWELPSEALAEMAEAE